MPDSFYKMRHLPSIVFLTLLISLLPRVAVAQEIADASQLGPGDLILVSVYEHPDLTIRTRVSSSGKISFPMIGIVYVQGATEREVEEEIAGQLAERNLVNNPQVLVLIEEHVSHQIAVLGQVRDPGKHSLDFGRSIFDVLAAAGGTTADAHDRVTILVEGDPNRTRQFDLSRLVAAAGESDAVPQLSAADVVFVPRMDVFYVYGEVQRPGSYRLESQMKVVQALSVAGSITDTGSDRGMKIRRTNPATGEVDEIDVDLNDRVEPRDVILVRERLF
jgi:polysaccharide export outer membrane protein